MVEAEANEKDTGSDGGKGDAADQAPSKWDQRKSVQCFIAQFLICTCLLRVQLSSPFFIGPFLTHANSLFPLQESI